MTKPRIRMITVTVVALAAAAGAGCSRTNTDQEARAGGRPPVAVEVAPVVAGRWAQAVEVTGALAPRRAADVRSEYSGTVAEVLVTEWDPVQRGATLARLDARDAAAMLAGAQAALLQAEVAETRAVREGERSVRLRESGLATQQSLDDARTTRAAAGAATAAARAQLDVARTRLDKTVIRAPIDGEVAFRGVDVGDYVENMGSPEPMFRVVDNRLLDLTVSVPAAQLGLVRQGQPVAFTTEAVPGRTFAGVVKRLNPSVDEATRAVKVLVEVTNNDGALRGGLFVRGRIDAGARPSVLQLPRSALLTWDVASRRAEVFAVTDNVARRCRIETGAADDVVVEVTAGLVSGDRVITRGAFNVRDRDRVNVIAAAGE